MFLPLRSLLLMITQLTIVTAQTFLYIHSVSYVFFVRCTLQYCLPTYEVLWLFYTDDRYALHYILYYVV